MDEITVNVKKKEKKKSDKVHEEEFKVGTE